MLGLLFLRLVLTEAVNGTRRYKSVPFVLATRQSKQIRFILRKQNEVSLRSLGINIVKVTHRGHLKVLQHVVKIVEFREFQLNHFVLQLQ